MAEKILVIDDHYETVNLVSVILKQHGYRLHMARSGIEGLQLAQQEDPDLILLDIMMPDMDGLEVCRRLRAQERFAKTPIIMFTAKSMADEKWEGFQAGATDYLVKPTNTEELTTRVRAVLNRSSKILKRQPEAPEQGDRRAGAAGGNFRPIVVTFVGARGGAGTTTALINAAYVMSRLYPTLLVDLDLKQGHVGQYLNIAQSNGLNRLLAGGVVTMRAQLQNELKPFDQQLSLLLAQPDLGQARPASDPKQITHLADALARSGRQVMIDAGCGISPLNTPLLERSDHIVVVLKPERLSIAAAKTLINHLDSIALPTTTIHPLLLDFSEGAPIPRAAIEKFIGRKIIDSIQISAQQMTQAVNRGLPLVKVHSDTSLPKSFSVVAKALVAA